MTSEPSRGLPPLPAIPGYRVVRLLGAGGMGRVYLAEDEALGRCVAVKVVSERFEGAPEARARFLREARAMTTVEHPAVVRIYSYGEREGAVYFVMEHVEGEPLSERLLRGRLTIELTLQLLAQVTDALEAAFEKGVVHRDIKPGNILLDRKGRAHVADFGLAKPVQSTSDPSLTDTGAILGTPYYVSPEQARGLPVDFRSDIYSLGIVAFEALAGDRPFAGTTSFEVVAKHIHEPLPDLRRRRPDVPEPVARAVEWMTAKDPSARPPSYAALRQALGVAAATDALASSPTQTRLPEVASTLRARAAKGWRRPVLVGAALLALVALVRLSLRGGRDGPRDDKQLVVAVAPFSGPDEESAKEGRLIGALVEREVVRRLGGEGARVLGVEETKQPVRDHAAARALGERLGASIVVWGDALAVKGETEIQPSFTLVPRPVGRGDSWERRADESAALRTALAGRDPSEVLQAMSTPTRATAAMGAIELRKTSAAGVGDLAMVLVGMHTLYNEGNAEKALALFERASKSAQSLRHRAEALLRLRRTDAAEATLREAIALEPGDAQAHAALGDLLLESDRQAEAERELRRAAELGGRYATRNGIVFEGKLYVRETFQAWREQTGTTQRLDSGYLLAVDAPSGRVLERHRLPGALQLSLSVGDGVLRISFTAGDLRPRPATATFAKGRFERPVFYGAHLPLRRRAFECGRALAVNFMDGWDWRRVPEAKQRPWAPSTLPELEARLRQAAERDPTQPWHLFFLGQALKAQERSDEAQKTWNALFAGAFPGTTYFEYSYMARLFETWGEPSLADRAYAEALARRKRIPQPIEACTLIERLVSANFIQAAGDWTRRGSDLERIYLWIERARELSGTAGEGDDLVATAWSRYFRQRGDQARAAREAQYATPRWFSRAYEGYAAAFDVASQAFLSLSFAAWAFLLFCLSPRRRVGGWRATVAGVPRAARRIALSACVLALLAFALVVRTGLDLRGISWIPMSLMDSLGSADNVFELERRLASVDTPPLRFATAVANHMAGNLDRARELYRPLRSDPRVESNLNALQAGVSAPREVLTAEDFFRAYLARPWSDWLTGAWSWGAGAEDVRVWPVAVSRLLNILVLALSAILFLLVPPLPTDGEALPARGWLLKALPGAADIRSGAPLRGYATLALLSFSVVVLGTQLSAGSIVPAAGLVSSASQPLKGLPWPLPASTSVATDAELERALEPFYWDFLRARPHVAALWLAALLAGVAALALHFQALRRVQNRNARPTLPVT